MGPQTVLAVLDAGGGISEVSTAVLAKAIQRTVTEQAAEGLRVGPSMAWEIFALLVLEKVIMRHYSSS